MFIAQTTLRATSAVCLALFLAFVITGISASAYRRERASLGRTHFDHAQGLAGRGDLGAALEEYRKALLFSPDKREYQVSLATALINSGHLDEAESHLEQLVQSDPTNGMINLLLARVALRRRETKTAVNYYQRAVYEYWPAADLPQRRVARWELAMLLNQSGDRTGFVAELMQLYTNLPGGDIAQKLRVGFLLASNGVTSEASQIFHDVLKQDPKNADARRGLGEVSLSFGDFVSARHEFQRAVRLNAADHESSQMLSLANDVIDVDPNLPDISGEERLRRSRNLLGKVLEKIEACYGKVDPLPPDAAGAKKSRGKGPQQTGTPGTDQPAPDPLHQQLAAAETLREKRAAGNEDLAATLQAAAQQLWKARASFCKGPEPDDKAVDMVVSRMASE